MITLVILSVLGVLLLLAEIIGQKKAALPLVIAGLTAALGASLADWSGESTAYFNNMMVVDNFSVAFTSLLIITTLLWFIMAKEYINDPDSRIDHFALIIFSLTGAVLMTSFNNLLMLFLAIEILSFPMYVLAGSRKNDLASNEAALKYFLMGAFATGFLLFGIALLYGVSGSFSMHDISVYLNAQTEGADLMVAAGVLLMLVGLSFKASAAPFHFWTPDVYTGAPTVITAFMSTVVKTAAFAAFFRLFATCFNEPVNGIWQQTLWVMAALTILTGNIIAVYQQNFKRMLAYSSIAHAGYMLLAILALHQYAQQSLLYYAVAYSVSSLAAFGILLSVSRVSGNDSIDSFSGLAKKNPFLAAVTTLTVLSLAGIPPLAGFFAKYYIFTAALQQGYIWLVIIAVLGSLIGVYYYFRVLIAMFANEQEGAAIPMSVGFKFFLAATALAALLLGIMPEWVAGLL